MIAPAAAGKNIKNAVSPSGARLMNAVTRQVVFYAALLGTTGVILGAFGAHALKERLLASGRLDAWETATLYHLLHAIALLGLAALAKSNLLPYTQTIARIWFCGVILFSGSIYALALTGWKLLGPVTPIGGLLLVIGWVMLGVSAFRSTSS